MNCGRPPSVAAISRSVRSSITAHYANETCRRQIEKSPLAQIEMSLSTVLVGEFWADDGDYDEPDGDRPDERVAGSGGEQDQSNGSRERICAILISKVCAHGGRACCKDQHPTICRGICCLRS